MRLTTSFTMTISKNSLFYIILILFWFRLSPAQAIQAQSEFTLHKNEPFTNFPQTIDFHLQVTASEPIVRAELEYGLDALTCGAATSVAVPTFDPTDDLDITWRWDLLQSSTFVPRGSTVWWRWRLTSESGTVWESPEERFVFADNWFVWQTKNEANVTVHWYRGSEDMAEDMLAAALGSIDSLAHETGLRLTDPVDLFLYDEQFDLRLSLPGAPGWVGGVAFPEQNIVMAIANEPYRDYARLTVRHEIGHLVIGRLTFNCLSSLPTWLNEGLAMVAEGEVDERAAAQLQEAITNNTLLSLQQLEGSFSIHAERATLAYAQSENVVRFLIDTYGQEKMLAMLLVFQQGSTPEEALLATYGFDTSGLERVWREAIGASAPPESGPSGPATAVPTLALAGVIPATLAPTPTATTTTPAVTPGVISSHAAAAANTPAPLSVAPTPTTPSPYPPSETNSFFIWGVIALSLLSGGIILFRLVVRK